MKWLRRGFVVAAFLYPACLVGVAAALRYVGELWWVTTVALYLPRVVLVIPLPLVVAGLLLCGRGRWLWTQAVSAMVLLFPLMGLVVPMPHVVDHKAPSIRVLSYNVNSAWGGVAKLVDEIAKYSPDVVLLQEVSATEELKRALLARYPTVEALDQFAVATRYSIVSTNEPARLPFEGRQRSPRFLEHVVDTPLGRVRFYNIHPVSPREDFYVLRGRGLRREILSGRIFSGAAGPAIQANAGLRALQAKTIAEAARDEQGPRVIAGDSNLPGLSLVFGRHFSAFHDGFVEAGSGFGYTYPNDRRPWMRIDRILVTDELRVVRFQVGTSAASDHLCVVGDLQRRP